MFHRGHASEPRHGKVNQEKRGLNYFSERDEGAMQLPGWYIGFFCVSHPSLTGEGLANRPAGQRSAVSPSSDGRWLFPRDKVSAKLLGNALFSVLFASNSGGGDRSPGPNPVSYGCLPARPLGRRLIVR